MSAPKAETRRLPALVLLGLLLAVPLFQVSAAAPGAVMVFAASPPDQWTVAGMELRRIPLAWEAPADAGSSPIDAYELAWHGRSATGARSGGFHTAPTARSYDLVVDDGYSYIVEIRPRNAEGLGPSTAIVVDVPDTSPGPVTDITASLTHVLHERGRVRANLNWSAPSLQPRPVQFYEIHYTGYNEARSDSGQTASGGTSQTLTLQQNMTYSIRIRGMADNAKGDFGIFVLTTPDLTPSEVRDLDVVLTNESAGMNNVRARITWTPPAVDHGLPLTYEINYKGIHPSGVGDSGQRDSPFPGNVDNLTLRIGYVYSIRIRAYNDRALGPYVETGISTEGFQAPGLVPSLSARYLSMNAQSSPVMHVSWEPPVDAGAPSPTNYKLRHAGYGAAFGSPGINAIDTGALFANQSFREGFEYIVRVRAETSRLLGSYATFFVDPSANAPGKARNVTTGAISSGNVWTLTANWEPALESGIPVARYEWDWVGFTPQRGIDGGSNGGTATSLQKPSAVTGSAYLFMLRTSSAAGWGEHVAIEIDTPGAATPGPLPPPANVQAAPNAARTQAVVSWSPPTGTALSITGYTVRYAWVGATERPSWQERNLPSTQTSTSITIPPGATFLATVFASSGAIQGDVAYARLRMPVDTPSMLQVTQEPGADPRDVVLRWPAAATPGGLPVTAHSVRWLAFGPNDDGGSEQTATLAANATSYALRTTPGAVYLVSLAASNAQGYGPAARLRFTAPDGRASTPQDVAFAPGPIAGKTVVTWAAPASPGASAITGYDIRLVSIEPGQQIYDRFATTNATTTSWTFTSQPAGRYIAYVGSRNVVGLSSYASATTTLVDRRAQAPEGLSVILGPGPNNLTLSWTPSVAPDTVTGYQIQVNSLLANGGDFGTRTVNVGAVDSTIVAATRGAFHTIRVSPVSAAGVGFAATARFAAPDLGPSAPVDLVASEGPYGNLTLTWRSPLVDGGLGIDRYVVSWFASAREGHSYTQEFDVGTTLHSSTAVRGNVTYHPRIWAVNAAGVGAAALGPPVRIPERLPSPPLNATASETETQIDLAWQPPAYDGELGISRYVIGYLYSNGETFGDVEVDVGTDLSATIVYETGATYSGWKVYAENAAARSGSTDFVVTSA